MTLFKSMRLFILTSISAILIISCITGCTGINKKKATSVDTVAFSFEIITDSNIVRFNKNQSCKNIVELNFSYPVSYKDSTSVAGLSQLYSKLFFDCNDSSSITECAGMYMKNILNELGKDSIDIIPENICENIPLFSYITKVNIYPVYNKNGILALCKEERIIKNNELSMLTHNYINIDLVNMKQVAINDIFQDETINDITKLLKDKLMSDLKIKDESDLMDLGYFNLGNLTANNNFCMSDSGIIWTFLPYEIACFSVGETRISIPYEQLSHYQTGNSILSYIK